MPFGESVISDWSSVISGVATALITGLFLWLRERDKTKFDAAMGVLREEHVRCAQDIAGLRAVNVVKDARVEWERRRCHDLANFTTVLFFDMGVAGVAGGRVEELRKQFLDIYNRTFIPPPPDGQQIGGA